MKTKRPLTYCNPLSIADVKSGRPLDTNQCGEDIRTYKDYRSISDPSVVYYDGKWILYPSYALAYLTEDFVHWEHIDIGVPDLRYSPAIVCFRGKWYLHGHGMSEVYSADSPLGPFTLCGHLTDTRGRVLKVCDDCYLADGDHLYLYWFGQKPAGQGVDAEFISGTMGAELNPDEPWQLLTEPVWLNEFDPSVPWQRIGEYNENERMGWIEGQWMTKIGSRYYLLYSGSGTRFGSYANGVAISEEGPLTGFIAQKKHDPFTEKRCGLLRGAGHGCIVRGPQNTYWTFYTSIFCYNHPYERRIGMDPVGIDENGELYCPAVTDRPQYAPGVLANPELGNDAGLLPLTFLQRPKASSAVPGRDALYASDDSILTWWQPEKDDPEKSITFPLGTSTGYRIESLRIIWRDINMETLDGVMPGPFKYVVEYAPSAAADEWTMLVDAANNETDLCIDYRQFDPVKAYAVRLRILGAPQGIEPGLVSLTVFGKCAHEIK
ncbi:MAG: family 43 glycosylhydrolase [Clostridiaceae bacterium]|nr:family 43 glycosylhydrolase [Clostridiaceae bacterium]